MRHNKDGEVKLFSQFGRFSLAAFLLTTTLYAESFEDFKRVQTSSYSKFKDPRDNGFNNYLKSQWQEYQAYITQGLYSEPKPKSIPVLQEKEVPKVGPTVVIKVPKKVQKPEVPKQEIQKIQKEAKVEYDILLPFFGSKLGFYKDSKIEKFRFYPYTQAGIANFFSSLASSNYKINIQEIQKYRQQFHLNDWALYLLVKGLAEAVYATEDESRIYQWFLLNKLGYDVKIALSGNHVYLLHYVDVIVYQRPRYKFGKKYYYILSPYDKSAIKKIYTYKKSYPQANKPLDFSLKALPSFYNDRVKVERTFEENQQRYTIKYSQNRNLLSFMKTYPQVDYSVYFNAAMDMRTYQEIASDIKLYCDGKKMAEAMNFVLHFVQKAFEYKRDDMQFGYEKVMFADETLSYNASDCEDRAVLYAQLVKRLFGVGVIGVKYSDHISTGLSIPMQGDSVSYASKRYVIADPTYINANIGEAIPKYRSLAPESFIRINY